MSPDSTIAWDTLAFALYRISHCLLCGAPVPVELGEAVRCRHCAELTTPWGSIWHCVDEDTQRQMACGFLVCHAHVCLQNDHRTIEAQVDQKLRARYGFVEQTGIAPKMRQGHSGPASETTQG